MNSPSAMIMGRETTDGATARPAMRAVRSAHSAPVMAGLTGRCHTSLDQLKDVVAQHRMDRSQLALKWRTPERLIELIVAQTISRAHKGEAFTR